MIDSKKVVTANVRRLLEHRGGKLPEGQSGVSRLKALGVSHGNAQRALSDDEGMRLATLDEIAAAFKMKPWQLLVPNVNPKALPTLAEGGSPNEPLSSEDRLTDSTKSEDEAGTVFDGLDSTGQALLGDIISIVRQRFAVSGEEMVGRDSQWSSENLGKLQGQQEARSAPAAKPHSKGSKK
jgi:hypothetical protein